MNTNFRLNTTETEYGDKEIFVLVLGTAVNIDVNRQPVANGDFSYLDFSTGALMAANFSSNKVTDTMVTSLDLLTKDSNGNYVITVPYIGSARLYISFGQSLTEIPVFAVSGPVNDKNNTVIYDKIEFDNAAHKSNGVVTAPNPNVNLTNVDFFGLSFTITAYDVNISKDRIIGYKTSRADIITAFNAIPDISGTNGNTSFMKTLVLKDTNNNLIRILSPKSASPIDLGSNDSEMATGATHRTHFWREYVNNECYASNRKFTCYSKLYTSTNPGPIYYGEIDNTGLNLNIYTDAARTQPYASCPTLPRPSNIGNLPDFSNGFSGYNMLDDTPVDWGFLLSANTEGSAAPNWATDPVAMAILISICRGCMHMNNADDWVNNANWYTANAPIFYYSSILHEKALNNLAYAFSYDDIFGTDPSIYFKGNPNIILKFGKINTTKK
ncbi:beta-1,3-glucanase family protein [uncultured Aquimarina sp.]|uniref:beta-1,3-glucanase family protein n=1 Tax=uncultured Aquimarina sp. TaxID=575652 RepID=UPI002629C8C9|nr:beta-1,3-glucanase family protein [uncultured Aquimarina sp.]